MICPTPSVSKTGALQKIQMRWMCLTEHPKRFKRSSRLLAYTATQGALEFFGFVAGVLTHARNLSTWIRVARGS